MAVLYVGPASDNLSALPDPQEIEVNLQDLDADGAGRSANGTMIRDRVAGGATSKRKIKLKWPMMNSTEMSAIQQAIKDVFFYCKYPDPYTGADRIGQFYTGDREAPIGIIVNGEVRWKELSVNFIEK